MHQARNVSGLSGGDDDDGGWMSWLPEAEVRVTDLRKDPNYIIYYLNWFCLLVTGVLPMAMLIFLNVNIYRKVIETR